jgi:hypothetical protein
VRATSAADFERGAAARADALRETEADAVALVEAGAEALTLEDALAAADREASAREVDSAAIVILQRRELVAATAARLPRDW